MASNLEQSEKANSEVEEWRSFGSGESCASPSVNIKIVPGTPSACTVYIFSVIGSKAMFADNVSSRVRVRIATRTSVSRSRSCLCRSWSGSALSASIAKLV